MQFTLTASTFLALVASSLALQVTSPAQGSSLDLSKSNTITWASVSSDPTSFNVVLVDETVNPSVSISIAQNVQTSAGSYVMSSVSGAAPGSGYQINLMADSANNNGILAQSAQFTVTTAGSSSTSSASFSSSTPSTSMSSTTATLTSTITSNGTTLTTTTTSTSASVASASSSSTSGSSSGSSLSGSSSSTSSTSQTSSSSTASASSSGSKSASASVATSTGAASTLESFAGAGVFAMLAALLL